MSAQQLTPGTYYGQVIEAGWTKSTKTISHGIALKFRATHVKDAEGNWPPLDGEGGEAQGVFWVIKADGGLNDVPLKQMAQVFGWDGDPEKVTTDWFGDPARSTCQFIVKEEEFPKGSGKFTTKVDSVWPKDSTGPGIQTLDANGVRGVKSQYGAALRAALGGGGPKPGGAPRPVPPAAPSTAPKTSLPPTPRTPPPTPQGSVVAAPAQREPGGDDAEGA